LDLLAQRLEAWLAPEDIIGAANAITKSPTDANKSSALVLASDVLTPDADGGLFALTTEYLHRFSVPATLISLLKNLLSNNALDAAWKTIEHTRFTGTIELAGPDVTDPPHSVLQIEDKDFLIDILAQPLKGLQGMVAASAETWRDFKASGHPPERLYHKHRMPEPYAVWRDAYVAGQYGFPDIDRADWLRQSDGPNVRYRAITIHNYRHSDPRLIKVTREGANYQAKSTLNPI
jgi:hypothetical protein